MKHRELPMSRLLVIEDQKKLLQSLERGLSEEGYEVIPAMTGEEGYLQAKSRPVDAVVLDLMLPERDGLDVLRSLRSEGFTKPILILTARDTDRGSRAGAGLRGRRLPAQAVRVRRAAGPDPGAAPPRRREPRALPEGGRPGDEPGLARWSPEAAWRST